MRIWDEIQISNLPLVESSKLRFIHTRHCKGEMLVIEIGY